MYDERVDHKFCIGLQAEIVQLELFKLKAELN